MFELEIRKATAQEALQNQHLWLVDITCKSTDVEVTEKVFVYHADAEQDGVVSDVFECVASIQQLVGTPEDDAVEGVPYYRTDNATYFCASAQEADELVDSIVEDVTELKAHILASRELTIDRVIQI